MKMTTTLMIALFSMTMCFGTLADGPAKEQIIRAPEQQEDTIDEDVFTKEDFEQEFLNDFDHETSRLRLSIQFPEMYALQGQSAAENYLSTTDWEYTEDQGTNDLKDALEHMVIKAAWYSRPGQAIQRWGESLKLRFFAEQEKKSDFESSNEVQYGFLLGSKGGKLPDFGFKLSNRPEFRMEFYQKSGVFEKVKDENGDETEEPILIRHRFSYRVTDLLNPETNGRVRYEIDNIRGWFGLTFEHDLEDQTTKFFFDGFEVAKDIYLYSGISYFGQENGFGFRNDQMVAPEGSVTLTVGMHGQVSNIMEIPKALAPWNWHSPFKHRQQAQERYAQRQRHNELLYAAAR